MRSESTQKDASHEGLITKAKSAGIDASFLNTYKNERDAHVFLSKSSGRICSRCTNLTFEVLYDAIERLADEGNYEAIYMTSPGSANMKTRHNVRLLTGAAVVTDSVVSAAPTGYGAADGLFANIWNNIKDGGRRLMQDTTQQMTDDMRRMKRLLERNHKIFTCSGESGCGCGCDSNCCNGDGPKPPKPSVIPDVPDIIPIADPAGFVYEAVPSNRVSGVTATIYEYKYILDEFGVQSENKVEVKWDAENYGQQNPLITGEDGMFAWDVPEGQWVVKFTKDGYSDANSYNDPAADDEGYLPVPVVQTEINTAIVSKARPVVQEVKATSDGIELLFSQYMKISSIDTERIEVICEDALLEGTIIPLDDEYNYDNTEKYARRFFFKPKERMSGSVLIRIENAVNYADTEMEGIYSGELDVDWLSVIPVEEIRLIDQIGMRVGQEQKLDVEILPTDATEISLNWSSSDPGVVAVDQDGIVSATGVGRATITVTAPSGVSADCEIVVKQDYSVEDADFTLPRALKALEDEAFMGSNARIILVPSSCERIGHLAFADSERLEAIFFENGELEFEEDFIEGCASLERIIAPEGSGMAVWAEENGY